MGLSFAQVLGVCRMKNTQLCLASGCIPSDIHPNSCWRRWYVCVCVSVCVSRCDVCGYVMCRAQLWHSGNASPPQHLAAFTSSQVVPQFHRVILTNSFIQVSIKSRCCLSLAAGLCCMHLCHLEPLAISHTLHLHPHTHTHVFLAAGLYCLPHWDGV